MKRIAVLGLLAISLCAQAQVSRISGVLERERMLNESATLLWGQRGKEAQGYVVAWIYTQGYDLYSLWNDNTKVWQFFMPASSVIKNIILYDPRAVCAQRYLGSNWCIVDTQAYPKKRGMHQNKEVLGYFYDDVKCVSHRAPIAVGKGRDEAKRKWGLVTRDPNTGVWSHSVDDIWDEIKIKLSGPDDIFYAQAHKSGYSALFALDGTVIAEGPYEALMIEDGQIKCKQQGQWHVLKAFEIRPGYTR